MFKLQKPDPHVLVMDQPRNKPSSRDEDVVRGGEIIEEMLSDSDVKTEVNRLARRTGE